MNSNCQLSIIVVVLNEEKRLPLLLKSISNEADNDIEVILIDNGSTDNTYGIMQEYARSHRNVKTAVIVGPLGRARNEAPKWRVAGT